MVRQSITFSIVMILIFSSAPTVWSCEPQTDARDASQTIADQANTANGKVKTSFALAAHKHTRYVRDAVFLRDRPVVVFAGDDGAIHFWNFRTNQIERVLKLKKPERARFPAKIRSLDLIPSLDLFASTSDRVMFWDVRTGRLVRFIGRRHGVGIPAFSSDGKLMATADGCIIRLREISTNTGTELWKLGTSDLRCDRATSTAFALGNRSLVIGYRTGTVLLLDVQTGKRQQAYLSKSQTKANEYVGDGEQVDALTVSPDGRLAAFSRGAIGGLRIIDLESKNEPYKFRTAARPYALAFSPDGDTWPADGVAQL
jgi:WD40 repeat protein